MRMNMRVVDVLDEYGLPHIKGFGYLAEAVELYDGNTMKNLYAEIARRHSTSVSAVARSMSMCAAMSVDGNLTPKEIVVRVKERILFDMHE